MVAVETLFLTALLSAFIGFVALFAFAGQARGAARMRAALAGIVVTASVVAVGSFVLYAFTPHEAVRTVYGAGP
jgi:ABC-type Fe3+-siderophore transport system permease subunit